MTSDHFLLKVTFNDIELKNKELCSKSEVECQIYLNNIPDSKIGLSKDNCCSTIFLNNQDAIRFEIKYVLKDKIRNLGKYYSNLI